MGSNIPDQRQNDPQRPRRETPLKAVDRRLSTTVLPHFVLSVLKRIQAWLTDRENLLFLAMIVVYLIPLWAFRYFPSQDGPSHLANATIIREYHEPDRTAFRAYYVFNQRFTPNWAGHLVLAGLMSLMSPLVAEKVFLSGYVILLPVAIRYAVLAVRRDSGFLAVLGFPFVYNYPLHMGFYTFSYSLAMFFFVSGYWLKHRERFGLREMVTLAILSILLYLCHIVSAVAAFLELVLMAVWLVLPEFGRRVRQRRLEIANGCRSKSWPRCRSARL